MIKHKYIVFSVIFLIIIGIIAASRLLFSTNRIKAIEFAEGLNINVNNMKFTIDETNVNNTFSQEYMVYSIIKKRKNNYDQELLSKFGFKNPAITPSTVFTAYNEGDWELDIFPYGCFDYRKQTEIDNVPITLSDDELIPKANSQLQSMDLLPNDFYVSNHFTELYTHYFENGVEKEIVKEKTVCFYRKINGYDVLGNSCISISYSNEGLTGITSAYSDYKDYKKYKCISYEKAIEKAKNSKALFNYDTTKLKGNIINEELNNIEIVYYDSPLENKATYLQPCYKFSGSITDDLSNTSTLTVLIPALSDTDTIS